MGSLSFVSGFVPSSFRPGSSRQPPRKSVQLNARKLAAAAPFGLRPRSRVALPAGAASRSWCRCPRSSARFQSALEDSPDAARVKGTSSDGDIDDHRQGRVSIARSAIVLRCNSARSGRRDPTASAPEWSRRCALLRCASVGPSGDNSSGSELHVWRAAEAARHANRARRNRAPALVMVENRLLDDRLQRLRQRLPRSRSR